MEQSKSKKPKEKRQYRFLCNELQQEIGYDSICTQYTELLLRDFAAKNPNLLADKKALCNYAKEYNLVINNYIPFNIQNTIAVTYISRVHTTFEKFLIKLTCYPGYPYSEKDDDTDLLTYIFNKVYPNEKDTSDLKILYYVCKYYRLIRNKSTHKGKYFRDDQDLKNALYHIQTYGSKLLNTKHYNKLVAPNSEDNLVFDDFVLYARALQALYEILFHTIDYNIDDIFAYYSEEFTLWKNKYKNKKHRCINKITTFLKMSYPKEYVKSKKNDIIKYVGC